MPGQLHSHLSVRVQTCQRDLLLTRKIFVSYIIGIGTVFINSFAKAWAKGVPAHTRGLEKDYLYSLYGSVIL